MLMALGCWLLGYADQALRIRRRGAGDFPARSRTTIRGFVAFTGTVPSMLFAREWRIVEERAAAAITSAQERGLSMVVAVGRIIRGAARAMLDSCDEAI